MKRVIYFCSSCFLFLSGMLAQTPPSPGVPGPPGDGQVEDVLPLEYDLLMIFLALALAFYYFKNKSFFSAKKNNS